MGCVYCSVSMFRNIDSTLNELEIFIRFFEMLSQDLSIPNCMLVMILDWIGHYVLNGLDFKWASLEYRKRKFDIMPHFTFKFITYVTIIYHVTFSIIKLL